MKHEMVPKWDISTASGGLTLYTSTLVILSAFFIKDKGHDPCLCVVYEITGREEVNGSFSFNLFPG